MTTAHPDPSTGLGYNVKYEYEVPLSNNGVPYPLIEWCGEHLKAKWGWYFESLNGNAIMTFENQKDAFWFTIKKAE